MTQCVKLAVIFITYLSCVATAMSEIQRENNGFLVLMIEIATAIKIKNKIIIINNIAQHNNSGSIYSPAMVT